MGRQLGCWWSVCRLLRLRRRRLLSRLCWRLVGRLRGWLVLWLRGRLLRLCWRGLVGTSLRRRDVCGRGGQR